VSDARKFVQCALGNHHAVIYGDYARQTKALSQSLGIGSLEL
jgi:L-fucose isomerase-like protein